MATLATGLHEQGVRTLLVTTHGPDDSDLIQETRATGVDIRNLSMRQMFDPLGPLRLLQILRSYRPQMIHTRTIRADLVGRVGAGMGIPVINNIVNLYPDDSLVRLGPVMGRLEMMATKYTGKAARLFVANSKAVGTNTATAFGLSPDRIRVVYDGLLLDRWTDARPADLTSHGVAPEHRVCLSVTRLHPQKGLEDLISAARLVTQRHPDVRFVVAGDGPDRLELLRQVHNARLDDSIVFVGHRADVANLLARADLFVLPSRFEGLPSAVIEAMAAGRAVVATSTAGVPELVVDGITGWLAPPESPQQLAAALLRAFNEDLNGAGLAGRRRAEMLFSADRMTADFLTIYSTLVRP